MRSLRGIAVAVLVLGLVIGCSDDAEPKAKPRATPSASKSASPSPTPTAKPPTVPAIATTDKGAIDFALYFVEVLNYTAASGKTDVLRTITLPSCKSCLNIIEGTDRTYDDGGYIRGDGWSVQSQSVFKPDSRSPWIVSFDITTGDQDYRSSSTAQAKHTESSRERVAVHLQPRGESWAVVRMERS